MFGKNKSNRIGTKKDMKLMTFLLAFATASAFFVPYMITGHGYFIFFGDFNVQQIPFYQYCHEAVKSGDFGWSWQTDLGSNFIGSYSFYLLGSPFFWLTLPFPNSFVPYLMGPLLILKFSCAALTAYLFIRRFTAKPETALIGGLLYAFSGFSVYNIFFNHFHEAIVFFPLLLLAMEMFLSEKRRGPLIFAVFICALSNYFFFYGMVVFAIIYWFVRMCSNSFRFKFTELLLMLAECVLGVALAAVILIPTFMEVMQNSRISEYMSGWGAVLYGKEQIFLNVIECFFFPPDIPARPVFFPGADVKWSSLGGWMPLFGMTGVITWLMAQKKGHWLRRLIIILAFMALIPGLNSAFYMFNTAYYARWFYMPILMMCLATALSLEDTEVNWNSAWRWSIGITLAFTAVIGFMPTIENGKITKYGLYTDSATNPFKFIYQLVKRLFKKDTSIDGDIYDLRFWVACLIAILSLVVLRAFIPVIKEKRSSVFKPLIGFICVVSVIYSSFYIYCGQSHAYEIDSVMIDSLIEGDVKLDTENNGDFSRIDVLDGVDNTGLYLGYSSINFFHSIVPASVTDFYKYIGIERSVATRPSTNFTALRSLVSVKYLLDPHIDNSKEFTDKSGNTLMSGFEFVGTQNDYDIYENKNCLPMGFCYNYYVTEEQLEKNNIDHLSNVMLKALIVNKSNETSAARFLKNLSDDYYIGEYDPDKHALRNTDIEIAIDCAERKLTAANSFRHDSSGFTSEITLEKENLVFFSVPFADGWTATVNGHKAEIIRANKGFMAVAASKGNNVIRFDYTTPGLRTGILVSFAAAVLTVIYVTVTLIIRKSHGVTPPDYPEGDAIARHTEAYLDANREAEHPANHSLLDDIDPDKIDAYTGFNGGFVIDDSALTDISESTDISSGKGFRISNDDDEE